MSDLGFELRVKLLVLGVRFWVRYRTSLKSCAKLVIISLRGIGLFQFYLSHQTNSYMLKAQGITKTFGNLQVLKGIDLDIEQGQIVSIVGASGAGKSTLLQILGTLDRPDVGKVWIDNEEITALSDKNLSFFRNQKIGFIFQFHNLLAEFTALENVCMPAWIGAETNKKGAVGEKYDEKRINEKATLLLEKLGLGHRLNHLPSELSGGEQQRTAVARALINDPLLIFADEPSGNLDSQNARDLHKLFFQLRDEFGHTFVMVTHNEELANMADRKLEMHDGVITNLPDSVTT